MTEPHPEVFISYSSRNEADIRPVLNALRAAGVTFWFAPQDLAPFSSVISERIADAIRATRLTLAFLSEQYDQSNACKWELIQTLRAGGLESAMLLTLPGYQPQLNLLAENLHGALPADDPARARLAVAVTAKLAALPARAAEPATALWWPEEWQGAQFAGRFHERLGLFSALTPHLGAKEASTSRFDRAQITGLGGQGKSLLALQFAVDASASFRAIARFSARGDQYNGRLTDPREVSEVMADLLTEQQRWVRATAAAINRANPSHKLELPALDPQADDAWALTRQAAAEVVAALGGRVLWLVDDVPAGLGAQFQRLLCPGRGRTLITTRGAGYFSHFAGGAWINLDQLTEQDAVYLLAAGDGNRIAADGPTLAKIAAEVGHHALSVAVLAHRLNALPATRLLTTMRSRTGAAIAELEAAAEHIEGLPAGHGASIVSTLSMSIGALERPASWAILQLAAIWPAAEPIPNELLDHLFPAAADDGVHELVTASLAWRFENGTESGAIRVHTQVSGVARWLDGHGQRYHGRGQADAMRAPAATWVADVAMDRPGLWVRADWGRTAWQLLEPVRDQLDQRERLVAARALIAMCRLPMQFKPADLSGVELVDHLQRYVEYARQAGELRAGDPLLVAGARAMVGTLLIDQASAHPDAAAGIVLGEAGRDELEGVLAVRQRLLPPGDADLDKARFNLGRVHVLGSLYARIGDSARAESRYEQAEAGYVAARDSRVTKLADRRHATASDFDDLASCHRGIAWVNLLRALTQSGLDLDQRRSRLAAARVEVAAARRLTRAGWELQVRAGTQRLDLATVNQTKDLAAAAKLDLAEHALVLAPDYGVVQETLAQLGRIDPESAVAAFGAAVPWGATDESMPAGLPPGWFHIARLLIQAQRGGRGETAAKVLREFRDRDLPALIRSLERAESTP